MDIPIWVWILNIVGVGAIVWFLSWRLKSKLAEVEDRHVMSGIRHRKRLDESEQMRAIRMGTDSNYIFREGDALEQNFILLQRHQMLGPNTT